MKKRIMKLLTFTFAICFLLQGNFTTAFAEEESIGVLVDSSANSIPQKNDCAVPDRIEKIPIDVDENSLTMRASSDETQADTIALDTFYSLSMEPGYIYRFYFTLKTTRYHTFETFGDLDTVAAVKVGSVTYSDDDSGDGLNAAVAFYGMAGTQVQIDTCVYGSTGGSTIFQMRPQRFTMYTFDYGFLDISTLADSEIPRQKMTERYQPIICENQDAYHPITHGFSQIHSFLNSEVFMFSGHGGVGTLSFIPTEDGVTGLGAVNIESRDMSNNKLSVFSSCYGGAENSMVDAAVKAGSGASIGFTDTVYNPSAKTFTDVLFTKLAGGAILSSAAGEAANAILLPFDTAKNYRIVGNEKTSLVGATVNPRSAPVQVSPKILAQFNEDMRNFNYTSFQIEGGKRYFKTFQGIISNDYYDVFTDSDGKITSMIKSETEINDVPDFQQIQTVSAQSKNVSSKRGSDAWNLIDSETHTIIIKKDGSIFPVEIIYLNYYNESNSAYFQDVECTNLFDGSPVDYSEINRAE